MKLTIHKIFIPPLMLISIILILFSCKNESTYNGDYNPEEIKEYKNDNASLTNKMDSAQAVDFISTQKLRELYELSTLAANTNDSVLSEMLWGQLKSYFPKKDTVEILSILQDLKTKKVKFASIENIKSEPKDSLTIDTIKRVQYTVNYYAADKKLIETNNRTSVLVLRKDPQQFQREFKFYFKTLDDLVVKDSISVGDSIKSKGTSPR